MATALMGRIRQVWSGELVLQNLRLNPTSLRKLNLPVQISHGYVGSLRVKIPWSRLGSESINIEILDVALVVSPNDPSRWSPDALRQKNLETKRAMLEELAKQAKSGKKAAKPASDKDKESEGYLTKFLNTVVDNISIYLNNVHLRCVRGPCRRPRDHAHANTNPA
jgi:vacuolar protein sorting-associated protein 13A/C